MFYLTKYIIKEGDLLLATSMKAIDGSLVLLICSSTPLKTASSKVVSRLPAKIIEAFLKSPKCKKICKFYVYT